MSCPLKYSRQYLEKADKVDPPDNSVLVIGRFLHKVLEFCANRGQQFGWYADVIDFDAVWMSTLKQVKLTHDEYCTAESKRIHTEEVFNKVLASINRHKLRVCTEMTICMDLNGKIRPSAKYLDRFFFGYIDFYAETPSGKRAMVIDYKSGHKSVEGDAKTREQLSNYVHYLFLRNPKLESVQYGGAYIPDEEIDIGTQVLRDSPEHNQITQSVEDFYTRYLETLRTTDFSPVPGFICNWCNYTYNCPA